PDYWSPVWVCLTMSRLLSLRRSGKLKPHNRLSRRAIFLPLVCELAGTTLRRRSIPLPSPTLGRLCRCSSWFRCTTDLCSIRSCQQRWLKRSFVSLLVLLVSCWRSP